MLSLFVVGVRSHAQESLTLERPNFSEANPQKPKLDLGLSLGGYGFNDRINQANGASVRLTSAFGYKFADDIELRANVSLTQTSDRSQADFGPDEISSGFRMREALVDYRPINDLTVSAGAINQERVGSRLLIDDSLAFPGFMQSYTWGKSKGSGDFVQIWAQQTIPTSRSLNTRREEKEAVPTFLTQTLAARQAVGPVTIRPSVTHFQFTDLPSKVAFESAPYGNTVPSSPPTSSAFQFPFSGWLLSSDLSYRLAPRLKFSAGFEWLRNTNAPDAFNTGQLGRLGSEWELSDIILRPEYTTFFNESDTSPAFYNSFTLGHNNRQGFGLQMEVEFKRYKFKLTGRYVDSDVINQSLLQSRSQFFELRLGTTYADVL